MSQVWGVLRKHSVFIFWQYTASPKEDDFCEVTNMQSFSYRENSNGGRRNMFQSLKEPKQLSATDIRDTLYKVLLPTQLFTEMNIVFDSARASY